MIGDRDNQSWETLVCVGFAGAFLAFIFFYATAPIADPDFWWHLKTGEIMVQSGGLLQSDPFTYTGDGVVSNIESVVLKGYWLWQLTAYGLYSVFGFNGIFLLNFIIVLALSGVVVQQMRRQGVEAPLTILLMFLGFSLVRNIYSLERPQVVSFLFAAILLAQLARVRDGGRFDWMLPLLMIAWANLHSGFVFGDIILLCFAAGAVIEYRQDFLRLRHIIFWVCIGIGASLINPNGALVFSELINISNTQITEFQSTWDKFQQGRGIVVILWLLIVLYGVGIWSARRFYWPEMIVAFFLAYASVSYMRNVAFFAVAMLPTIGFSLQQGMTLHSKSISPRWKYSMILIAAVGLLWQANVYKQKTGTEQNVSPFFPEESSRFILSSGLQGRMLNSYNFGGYQIWRFYPQHRVFIDNRGLDPDIYRDAKLMTSASLQDVGGRKEFEMLLDSYAIDYVVQANSSFDTGRVTPLLKFLLVKPEWIPVYVDRQSFILVRNSPINAPVIERYKIDKLVFNNKLIGHLTALCNARPAEVINHITLAEMLLFVGRYAEAGERLSVIARLQPDNADLPSLRNQLAVLKKGKKS